MVDALTELQVQLDNGQAAALDAEDMFANNYFCPVRTTHYSRVAQISNTVLTLSGSWLLPLSTVPSIIQRTQLHCIDAPQFWAPKVLLPIKWPYISVLILHITCYKFLHSRREWKAAACAGSNGPGPCPSRRLSQHVPLQPVDKLNLVCIASGRERVKERAGAALLQTLCDMVSFLLRHFVAAVAPFSRPPTAGEAAATGAAAANTLHLTLKRAILCF